MTPEEQAEVDRKLKEVAEILYKNIPDKEFDDFQKKRYTLKGTGTKAYGSRYHKGTCP